MNRIKSLLSINAALVLMLCSASVFSSDADDVRATIERHYAFINAKDYEAASNHHLPDFTMFFPDGGPLWEADYAAVGDRMSATANFPDMNVMMTNYKAQSYGDVVVVTFFLRGTHTTAGEVENVVNRVSAVWVKTGQEWIEAHHHESPLEPK